MPNSDYTIQAIPAIAVERFWHFAEPYVKRALDHASGELTVGDMHSFCLKREVQLWLVTAGTRVVGAATTEIVIYPQKKHCRVITIAGSGFEHWVQLFEDTMECWARQLGCHAMEAHVRKGLVGKLASLGYKHKHSTVVKVLPEGIIAETQQPAQGDSLEQKRRRQPNHTDSPDR